MKHLAWEPLGSKVRPQGRFTALQTEKELSHWRKFLESHELKNPQAVNYEFHQLQLSFTSPANRVIVFGSTLDQELHRTEQQRSGQHSTSPRNVPSFRGLKVHSVIILKIDWERKWGPGSPSMFVSNPRGDQVHKETDKISGLNWISIYLLPSYNDTQRQEGWWGTSGRS